uniref:Sema domain-containing protein n=1 Tax=Cyprinodon variegatus TaxID=28743 RepID=A0A3Q2C8G5_CYPVA
RPVISRHLSEGSRVDLKLDDTLGWLEDPTFISSKFIPQEQKIYFFFSEVGREYNFVDKFLVSRVSQICMVSSDGLMSFCLGENKNDNFSAVNNGRSAVCAFSLTEIKSIFSGNYKVLNRDTLQWSTRVQDKVANPGECGLHNASDNALRFVKENFLAEDSVRPVGRRPTMVSAEHAYSHLTVQRVQAANKKLYTVLFLLTGKGGGGKFIWIGMVYVGTSVGVVRIPTANCSYYWTCAQCVLSRDPFCGWDPVGRACVEVSETQTALQDIDGANVEEACNSISLTHRGKFGPSKLPTGELVSVSLNEVVRLHCPAASQLSQQLWERPNSRLSSDLYLHLKDGSLSFVATPATLGHYLCLSTENGYRQTMAIYQVKQRSNPVSQTPTGYTRLHTRGRPTTQAAATPGLQVSVGGGPKTTASRPAETKTSLSVRNSQVTTKQLGRNVTLWMGESGQTEAGIPGGKPVHSARCTSFLKELVVVSILLVLCLSLLLTITLYVLRQRCRRRTAPVTGSLSRNSERRTPEEQEALRENEFGSKCNGQAPLGGHASGLVCNGNLTDSTQNLPNTPF